MNFSSKNTDEIAQEVFAKMKSNNLTARDYIAIKAMQGIIRRWDGHPFGGGPESPHYKELAEESYLISDAMIKEGSK